MSWNGPHKLVDLEKNRYLLPDTYASEWCGVYRIFVPGVAIDRCCGADPTGTLYIGEAGTRGNSLRNRLKEIVKKTHHTMEKMTPGFRKKFPSGGFAIQWAFTKEIYNYEGESIPGGKATEGWLLMSYKRCFGEYPPWNEKG